VPKLVVVGDADTAPQFCWRASRAGPYNCKRVRIEDSLSPCLCASVV